MKKLLVWFKIKLNSNGKELSGLKKDLTVLIIAHRLSTLKGCDKIIKLHNNGEVDVGEYDEMINS